MHILQTLGLIVPIASLGYQLLALWSVARFRTTHVTSDSSPGITVIKPIHGLDAQLHGNLRSFCEQDYREFQIIFAVASDSDPALAVIRSLIDEYPRLDLSLVVSDRRVGSNNKISNVNNGAQKAKHDLLVIADSDMRVGRNYLSAIAKAFEHADVGAATCLYTGSSAGRLASHLGCMYINESFLPSILVALRMEPLRFCFGATMAVRRHVLDAIGGFARLSNYLADDYMLGKLVSEQGYRVVLAPVVVENIVQEQNVRELLRHELRWARTVRTVRPGGYAFSVLTQTVVLALLGVILCRTGKAGWAIFAVGLVLRLAVHYVVRRRFEVAGEATPQLVPLRELMNFSVWVASFLGNNVEWRGSNFAVAGDGKMVNNEVVNS